MSRFLGFASAFLAAFGSQPVRGQAAAWQSPQIEACISIRAGDTGRSISLSQMLDELEQADVVFLGETHDDDTTHRLELAVYEGLLKRRGSKVVLGLEMFERDVQPHLDAYLAGKIDEKKFLAQARPWQNYHEAYRPLIETAKTAGAPVIASNFPSPLRMKLVGDPVKAIEDLGDQTNLVPAEFLPNSEIYWKRTDNAIRGHLGMMPAGNGGDRRFSTQSLWDNSMGESCAIALDKFPGYAVVHVNGGFHSANWDGTVSQLKQRKPTAKIKTVAIYPAANPASAKPQGAPVADFLVLAEQRALNRNEGEWAVFVNRKVKYHISLPPEAANERTVPLLIWLGSDGESTEVGRQFWNSALKGQAAVVVIEPPYRETQRDLSTGGRWFWSNSFSDDIASMVTTVERVASYVLERYPIDANRICLAGEGTGATVVSAVALLTDRLSLSGVAIHPRQYAKIKDFPLPLLEDWGAQQPPKRSLEVIGHTADANWWTAELLEYRGVGLATKWTDQAADPWLASRQPEFAVSEYLKLDRDEEPDVGERRFILVGSDSPLELGWARMHAQRLSKPGMTVIAVSKRPESGGAKPIDVEISREAISRQNTLPKCPGPFGGTTILVVNAAPESAELKQWMELEQQDPLNRHSRFHRLRIATMDDGDQDLQTVLTKLIGEKRTNVLIVPAEFYAGETQMRELERKTTNLSDQLTIHWLPGLGGLEIPFAANQIK